MKSSQRFLASKDDDYPGFQPIRSWANTYAQDCSSRQDLFKMTFFSRKG